MLEASQYADNTFATLTYRDEKIPSDYSVRPSTLSAFVKRLRKNSGLKFRYFGVGEYGEDTGRPHYHLALFGYPHCQRGFTLHKKNKPFNCCSCCNEIAKAWSDKDGPLGGITLGLLEQRSAAYVAGYVVKKMTAPDDERLEGRLPEFARMSLRPGIGLGMMHELASKLLEHKLDEKMIDVPMSLKHGGKPYPLGRYLRRKLRVMIGKDEKTPQKAIDQAQAELHAVRQTAFENSRPFKEVILETFEGKRLNIMAKQKIRRKRGTI